MIKTNKELKHLSRRELVDIIYQLKKNEQEMQEEIEALKIELEDRRFRISTARAARTNWLFITVSATPKPTHTE